MRKRLVVALVSVALVGSAGLIADGVHDAGACSVALAPITVDPPQAAVGDMVHVSGGPQFEFVPEAEQPSTTTTTLPDGQIVATCSPTRPITHQTLSFVQGESSFVLAEVDGDTLDIDVVIPDGAAPGPATMLSTSGGRGQVEITSPPATPVARRASFTG